MTQCWSCWDNNNTKENPLVRACYGCVDKDLQYIHVDCLESYLSSCSDRTEFRCTRCLDLYPVQVKWSKMKAIKESPASFIPFLLMAFIMLCFFFVISTPNRHVQVRSPVLDYFQVTVSLITLAYWVLSLQTLLSVVFIWILFINLPAKPVVKWVDMV